MRNNKGFSLVELLIVVAIILVISAIAIPRLLRSRMAANEASAVSSIKNINTAQIGYSSTYPELGYADTITKLGMPNGAPISSDAAGFLDWVLACPAQPCPKSGYKFSIIDTSGTPISDFRVVAVPIDLGTTGIRGFCSDQLSKITFDPAGGMSCTQPLQ